MHICTVKSKYNLVLNSLRLQLLPVLINDFIKKNRLIFYAIHSKHGLDVFDFLYLFMKKKDCV